MRQIMATNNRNDGSVQKSSKPKSHPLNLIRLLQMIFIVPYISILRPFKLRFSNAAHLSQFCPVQGKSWVKTSLVKGLQPLETARHGDCITESI